MRQPFVRTLPDPVVEPYKNYSTIFVLTIDLLGPGSSMEAERKSLPLEGFGSMLCFDYLDLAKRKAAEFIKAGGYTIGHDRTTIRGVDMILLKDK